MEKISPAQKTATEEAPKEEAGVMSPLEEAVAPVAEVSPIKESDVIDAEDPNEEEWELVRSVPAHHYQCQPNAQSIASRISHPICMT